jgi:hypothetical protein
VDLATAWESNLCSARHEGAQRLSPSDQDKLKAIFLAEMSEALDRDRASLVNAEMLYAVAQR